MTVIVGGGVCHDVPAAQANRVAARPCPPVAGQSKSYRIQPHQGSSWLKIEDEEEHEDEDDGKLVQSAPKYLRTATGSPAGRKGLKWWRK